MIDTPVLFIIFNRPGVTLRVINEIKKQKPKFLFIAADGPRAGVEDDIDKCRRVRELVLNTIDWECEVKTLFRKENLGCGKGVSGAIDWFFENVEMGIILEDDCLPNRSFFNFCEILLNHYEENDKVFAISGVNFQDRKIGKESYFFSKYLYVWGWATWRRAWNNYDFDLSGLENFKKEDIIKEIDSSEYFKRYWYSIFEKVSNKEIDTWDYQLVFSSWKSNGLTIVPNKNLVSNIGFGTEATHTTQDSPLANMKTEEMILIKHPKKITRNKSADNYISSKIYKIPQDVSNYKKVKQLLGRIFDNYGL